MKKVLIALDYDPTAQKVAEQGYSLAKSLEAEVILLHVVTDPVYYTSTEYSPIMGFNDYAGISPFQLENIEGLIHASQLFLDKTKLHLKDQTIQTAIKEGDVADAVLKAAKDFHADMIVMGTHSHKWLESIVLGSVTSDVVNRSRIPLFIIPTKKQS